MSKLGDIVRACPIRHWTARYLYDRFKLFLYEIKHSDCPWLAKQTNEILQSWLKKTDAGLEWGSGRSSIWFARRVARLVSVEHDPIWYRNVKTLIQKYNITNAEIYLCEVHPNEEINNPYMEITDNFPDNCLDFVLVDGIFRSECALRVLKKIKPCGLLIIDNINWYLPSTSNAPNSRTRQDGPASQSWTLLSELLKEWRCIWTSNGVFDTAIYVKPCPSVC